MRTQQNNKVKAIVDKYKKLASETEEVKIAEKTIAKGRYGEVNNAILNFEDQLVGYIYHLLAGNLANPSVTKKYALDTSHYVKGLLQREEEQYLADNFASFVDYVMEVSGCCSWTSFINRDWVNLIPLLLENRTGSIFLPDSFLGKEFIGLKNIEISVGEGFARAAVRAFAYGLPIQEYLPKDKSATLWSDIEDEKFDTLILKNGRGRLSIKDSFDSAWRITKNGGEILFCIQKSTLLEDYCSEFFFHKLIQERALHKIIQLSSDKVLFHIIKRRQNSFIMCDATSFNLKDKKVVDAETIVQELKKAESSEYKDSPFVCRLSYDMLNENFLLPSLYTHSSKSGTPIGELFSNVFDKLSESDMVLSDKCTPDKKVVTINNLSNTFSKASFKVDELQNIRTDRWRPFSQIEGPVVIMAVSNRDIAVGYTTENASFLVPCNFYALRPKNNVDVKYLACQLLNSNTKDLLTALAYKTQLFYILTTRWEELIRVDLHSTKEEQLIFIQDTISEDYAAQKRFISTQEKSLLHSIRLRKHALSQNISAFDSIFQTIEYCMKKNKGELKAQDQISPVSSMTVADAMNSLHSGLETICKQVAHLTDEQDWGPCEAIEPQLFIENYERLHANPEFRFSHSWLKEEIEYCTEDIFDDNKLLFRKGESMNMVWFPKKALLQVFDNIVSNACEHGFKDKNKDYVITTGYNVDGFNMIIKISNNGEPLPADLNTDLILEYGYTSAMNQNGHSGIGGGEIAEIMHKFGGSVKIISTPDEQFTVTYELSIPLASIY